jgi:hypothetical protein
MSTVAQRVAQHRARRTAGRVVLQIEVDEIALADTLIEARLLDPDLAEDRTALAQATARLLKSLER